MNKKINSVLAIGIILVIAIIAGLSIFLANRTIKSSVQLATIKKSVNQEKKSSINVSAPPKQPKSPEDEIIWKESPLDSLKVKEITCNEKVLSLEIRRYFGEEQNSEKTKFTFKKQDLIIGDVFTPGPTAAYFFKHIGCNLYISIKPDGLGGFYLYSSAGAIIYKVDLLKNSMEKLVINGDGVMDINNSETRIVITMDDNIIGIQDFQGNIIQKFEVLPEYEQFGDAIFSPDEKKIAYGATQADPYGKERGAIYIADIESGKQTKYKQATSGYYQINGWKNNNEPDYILLQ